MYTYPVNQSINQVQKNNIKLWNPSINQSIDQHKTLGMKSGQSEFESIKQSIDRFDEIVHQGQFVTLPETSNCS